MAIFFRDGNAVFTEKSMQIPGLITWGCRNSGPGSFLPPPLREGAAEFTLVAQGLQQYRAGGTLYTLAQGQVFVRKAEDAPCEAACSHQSLCYWFCVNLQEADALFMGENAAQQLRLALEALARPVLCTDKGCLQLAEEIQDCLQRSAVPMLTASLLVSLLFRILFGTHHGSEIARAIEYIQTHIGDALTLDEISKAVGASKSTLQHKFPAVAGESVKQFILSQKIEHSKAVLLQSGSVSQTAAAFGFSSASHYSNSFEKITKLRPHVFIKQYGTQE